MKFTKSIFLINLVSLLSVPILGTQRYEEGPPMGESPEGMRPDKVKKEWRIKALQEEIKHAENSVAELKKHSAGLAKGSEEFTIFKLRNMLKEDYLRGMKELLNMEEGKTKRPEMRRGPREEEGEEFEERPSRRKPPQRRPRKRVRAEEVDF